MCIVTTQINSTNNLVEQHNSLLTHTTPNMTSYGARLAPGICTWVWAKLNNNVHRVQTWNSIYFFCEPKLAIYLVPVWQQILTNESTSNITDCINQSVSVWLWVRRWQWKPSGSAESDRLHVVFAESIQHMQGTKLWQLCGEGKYESCPQWGYDSCAHSVQQPSFQNMGLITNDRDRKEDNGCYQHSTLCLLSCYWAAHKTGISSQGYPCRCSKRRAVVRSPTFELWYFSWQTEGACVWQIKCYLVHCEFPPTPMGVCAR